MGLFVALVVRDVLRCLRFCLWSHQTQAMASSFWVPTIAGLGSSLPCLSGPGWVGWCSPQQLVAPAAFRKKANRIFRWKACSGAADASHGDFYGLVLVAHMGRAMDLATLTLSVLSLGKALPVLSTSACTVQCCLHSLLPEVMNSITRRNVVLWAVHYSL